MSDIIGMLSTVVGAGLKLKDSIEQVRSKYSVGSLLYSTRCRTIVSPTVCWLLAYPHHSGNYALP